MDFLDLRDDESINRGAESTKKEDEIIPSYDFQPMRTVGSSPLLDESGPRRGLVDSKSDSSNLKYAGILESQELTKGSHAKETAAFNAATISEVDQTVKKHADRLIHALENVSSRLSHLESNTHHLESSVDELNEAIKNNNGSIKGRLGQLENILREVQAEIQVLHDKQEISETRLQLAKLQASKGGHWASNISISGQHDPQQQEAPPQQFVQQSLQPLLGPSQQPQVSPPPAPYAPPPVQFAGQVPQSQVPSLPSLQGEPFFIPQAQSTDSTHQEYHTLSQQPQPPAPQPYQSAPQLAQYSQPPEHPQPAKPSLQHQGEPYFPLPAQSTDTIHHQYHVPSQQAHASPPQPFQNEHHLPQPNSQQLQPLQPANPLPQTQASLSLHPEEPPLGVPPSQTYAQSIRQPYPVSQSENSPPQHFYGQNPGMYEPSSSRLGSGQQPSAGYGPPMRPPSFSNPYSYPGSPSHCSSSAMRPSPFSTSADESSGGSSSYYRLPTAQILPLAQPVGPSGSHTENRVPIDDVVDKVVTMGFSRDQVRAAVRKLMENGQSVDLNVVLDKLMNSGEI